jgi:hypothetical protein
MVLENKKSRRSRGRLGCEIKAEGCPERAELVL